MTVPASARILPLREEDLDTVVAIERASFPDPWTPGMFREEFSHPHSTALALRTEDELAAYLFLRRVGEEWWIMTIAVKPERRRKGLARMLLDHALREARRAGIGRFILEVNEHNLPAIRLYTSFGFRTVGRRPGYYARENAAALVMELRVFPGPAI